ncbi:MAG TPA: biliverdin-producing heme oxygenase [Flavobacterium sp.]|jgi:heme oxygenase
MISTPHSTPSTFLNTLRTQTNDAHKMLESLPVSEEIISKDLVISDYIKYLQLMYSTVKQVETEIYPLVHEFVSDLDLRHKSQLIERDLAALSCGLPQLQHVYDFPQPVSTAFAFGILYVIEGSTLGGRYILKNVEQALHLNFNNGASYFAGYQTATGSRWKSFLSDMTKFENETQNSAEIIAGAEFGFNSIYLHLKND